MCSRAPVITARSEHVSTGSPSGADECGSPRIYAEVGALQRSGKGSTFGHVHGAVVESFPTLASQGWGTQDLLEVWSQAHDDPGGAPSFARRSSVRRVGDSESKYPVSRMFFERVHRTFSSSTHSALSCSIDSFGPQRRREHGQAAGAKQPAP